MGWKGAAIGAGVGFFLGHSWLGALFGAWFGHGIEERKRVFGGGRARSRAAEGYASMSDSRRSMIFCASVAAMLAKIAKADGRVSRDEIAGVEMAFERLGFSPEARAYAINVFRKAKDDSRPIRVYAAEFAQVVDSVEVRELLYEILWDVACADGRVGQAELAMLREVPRALRIRQGWFDFFVSSRLRGGPYGGAGAPPRDPLAEAYGILGASASDSSDELKRKYRELAKKNHPDALRAQGLPEAMVSKATERMSRINDAWAAIRKERGI